MKLLNNKIIGVPEVNPEKVGKIFLPGIAKQAGVAVPVKVLFVGSKFVHKDFVKVGDIIYASKYFGDVLPMPRFPDNARVYAGEDVLAVKER